MEKCRVDLRNGADKSYDILIGEKLSGALAAELKNKPMGGAYAIITDSNVGKLYGKKMLDEFRKENLRAHLIIFPAGEKSKTRETKQRIEDKMLALSFRRDSCIISLGGGVAGDMAGFTAATYMRGISYIQVPTTLLAMVDSSIGGKTGVDTKEAKNAIGAFYQPRKVVIDTDFLKTLPKKEMANGLAELIKHALIADMSLFHFLEKNIDKLFELDSKILSFAIKRSCEIKSSIVMQDEKEKGIRKLLNYGHTIGHAVESAMDYKISHGNAIAVGMSCAAKISAKLGFLDEGSAIRQNNLLEYAGLRHKLSHHEVKIGKILERIRHDKKIINEKINFVLLESIGDAFVSDAVTDEDITNALNGK